MSSGSGESSSVQYDLSSDDDEYSMPKTVAQTMVGQSDRTAYLLPDPKPDLNSTPE
jgi:hypothetical protein